jgi:hypothetical protein
MTRLTLTITTSYSVAGMLIFLSACSVLPEDVRATLPESMRGDTRALTDYPTPNLKGTWTDTDFPELTIKMTQSGSDFTFTRNGKYREIPVKATYKGQLQGRSVKIIYQAMYPGNIRPKEGQCFGVTNKDSSALKLTCEDAIKGTYPMSLEKA